MSARRISDWWYCDFRFQDKRYRIKCPENTRRAAEQFERILRQRLMHGLPIKGASLDESVDDVLDLVAERRREEDMPVFRAFAAEFMDTYAKTNNKPSEQQTKRYHLSGHLLPAVGNRRLDKIGTRDIEHLKAKLLGKGLSRKRVNNVIGTLSRILTYAVEIELLEKAPNFKRLKVEQKQMVFLDFAPYEALVEAAEAYHPMWYVAILLAGDAGLRVGEIRALRVSNWDRWRGRISVERSIWERTETATKGWKRRTIPLTERLQAGLEALEDDGGLRDRRYVLGRTKTKPLTDETVEWHLKRVYEQAGIAPVGWHALRHTFCSHLAMLGVPPRTIQELAGHADLRTTLKYMHLVEGEADRGIRLLQGRTERARNQADRPASGHEDPENVGKCPRGAEKKSPKS